MRCICCIDIKVLGAIIIRRVVQMMDDLMRFQKPPELVLHHEAMF